MVNSVSKLRKDRSIPIFIANNTNRTIEVYRHAIIAKIENVKQKLTEVNSVLKNCHND